MDRTLKLIFAISQTMRNIKELYKRHQNNFKSYEKFQNLKDLAQKLSPPRPFVFWTQNGCISLDFEATKKCKKSFFMTKKIQLRCVFYIFALASNVFELSSKTRYFPCGLCPMARKFSIMGHKLQGKYRVFEDNSKNGWS